MDLKLTQDWINSGKKQLSKIGDIMFISKSNEVSDSEIDNVIKIIDEAGNEVNCTVDKFIEIFDNYGLEGFLL